MKKAIVLTTFILSSTFCFGQATSPTTKEKVQPPATKERFVIKKRSTTKAVHYKPKTAKTKSIIRKRP